MKRLLIAVTLTLPTTLASQDAPPRAGFHHVHLNSTDPAAAMDFYARTFDVTTRTKIAGLDAIQSEKIYLLFDKVAAPPATSPDTAIWHFGWGSPAMADDFAKHQAGGIQFATPLSTLASGTVFAYMKAPDGALVEINSAPTRAFVHVHLTSEKPLCTADWYVRHLGAVTRAQPRAGPCEAPFAAPSEPLGVIRSPAATVRVDDISLIIYPRQKPGAFAGTRGHVVDHIAVSYPDVAAALARLKNAGVNVLEDVHPFGHGGGRAAMIEGPDGIAIELVEKK